MKAVQKIENDRVRNSTSMNVNKKIDRKIAENVVYYSNADKSELQERINTLNKEWDIERTLELNASLFALTGILLGLTRNKKWFILPTMVTAFLAQHAIQGWCPPVTFFRRLGVRTQKEIEAERHALLQILEETDTATKKISRKISTELS